MPQVQCLEATAPGTAAECLLPAQPRESSKFVQLSELPVHGAPLLHHLPLPPAPPGPAVPPQPCSQGQTKPKHRQHLPRSCIPWWPQNGATNTPETQLRQRSSAPLLLPTASGEHPSRACRLCCHLLPAPREGTALLIQPWERRPQLGVQPRAALTEGRPQQLPHAALQAPPPCWTLSDPCSPKPAPFKLHSLQLQRLRGGPRHLQGSTALDAMWLLLISPQPAASLRPVLQSSVLEHWDSCGQSTAVRDCSVTRVGA